MLVRVEVLRWFVYPYPFGVLLWYAGVLTPRVVQNCLLNKMIVFPCDSSTQL